MQYPACIYSVRSLTLRLQRDELFTDELEPFKVFRLVVAISASVAARLVRQAALLLLPDRVGTAICSFERSTIRMAPSRKVLDFVVTTGFLMALYRMENQMSACCSGGCASAKPPQDPSYRRILWIALIVNAVMFGIELFGGWTAGSVSLLADAVDFFGDAANYAVSLFVLGLAPIWRSRTAFVKGLTMGGYGIVILIIAVLNVASGAVPQHMTMGKIGFLALVANLTVAALLFAYRNGDSNMRSVWLCTRNDVIGNVAVMLAALGVFGTGTGWPDILVAAVMGVLGLTAARSVIAQARIELKAVSMPVSPVTTTTIELKRR